MLADIRTPRSMTNKPSLDQAPNQRTDDYTREKRGTKRDVNNQANYRFVIDMASPKQST
jgi:hypothetical protein